MEQYLRCYVNYLQDDWADWLPLAEFAANNQASETTGVSPVFGMYGLDPRSQFDLSPATANDPDDQRARATATTLAEIHDHLRTEMHRAQLRHQESADANSLPAPRYQVGDMVWIDGRNWKTRRPAYKLDNKRHGPFRIRDIISLHALRLDLPPEVRVHKVVPTVLLERATNDPYPGQRIPPPPPVEVDGEEEWEVEQILDSRIHRRRLQYLVKWTGHDIPDWRPAEDMNELAAVDRFHENYPNKPGPLQENH
jgi:hypothetical protein